MSRARKLAEAERVATHLTAALGHDQIVVRPHGKHLHIRLIEDDLETLVARLTEVRASTFTAAFRNHAGRWEQLPGTGNLEDTTKVLFTCLEPHLQVYP